jgi:PIN domain nuclease of toxin-antitoxin system
VNILLDTQCWLWMCGAPNRFTDGGRRRIASPDNRLFLSAASAWEIAIKYSIGKLRLPLPPAEYVRSRAVRTDTTELPITQGHALRVASLPFHHRDPFDRLLIAQAQVEGLRLMTADPQFDPYEVDTLGV